MQHQSTTYKNKFISWSLSKSILVAVQNKNYWQATDRKKIFAGYISDNKSVSKIYILSCYNSLITQNDWIFKWADLNRHVTSVYLLGDVSWNILTHKRLMVCITFWISILSEAELEFQASFCKVHLRMEVISNFGFQVSLLLWRRLFLTQAVSSWISVSSLSVLTTWSCSYHGNFKSTKIVLLKLLPLTICSATTPLTLTLCFLLVGMPLQE